MTPYLLGGSGALLGVVVALWFRYKLAKAQGALKLEQAKTAALDEKLESACSKLEEERQTRARAAQRHRDEMGQKEAELVVHRRNEDALREALAKGGVKGLIALANKQYGTVPPGND
jgi:hypothetical protein